LIQTFHKTNSGGKFNARALQQYAAFIEALQYIIPTFTHKSYFLVLLQPRRWRTYHSGFSDHNNMML